MAHTSMTYNAPLGRARAALSGAPTWLSAERSSRQQRAQGQAGCYGWVGARFNNIASTGGVTIAVSSDIATMIA